MNVFHMGMGEPFVPATKFEYDEATGVALGKAFDCRAGVAAELLALRELSGRDDLPFDVVASVSAMEEVGERGVLAAAMRFNPMVAFMFEGCPADDTFTIPDDVQTAFRRGPMFRYFDCCMIAQSALPALRSQVRLRGGACVPDERARGRRHRWWAHPHA